MPLLLWPFPTGGAPPPPPPRTPDGKVFVIDSVSRAFYGPPPHINESCVVVFNVGPGPTLGTTVRFFFINPRGQTQEGDDNFAFLNTNPIAEIFPLKGFPAQQAFIYTFAVGELNMTGLWSLYVVAGNYVSNVAQFRVTPLNFVN